MSETVVVDKGEYDRMLAKLERLEEAAAGGAYVLEDVIHGRHYAGCDAYQVACSCSDVARARIDLGNAVKEEA